MEEYSPWTGKLEISLIVTIFWYNILRLNIQGNRYEKYSTF